VDVYLYSFGNPRAMVVLHHVAYGTVSPYQRVASGDYTVAMRGAGAAPTSKPVLSASVDVTAGHAYTVAGMGPFKALRLEVLHDQLRTPPGATLVRIIQASLKASQVTVTAGARAIARKLPFGRLTGYQTLTPGTWTLHARGPGDHATTRLHLTGGSIHTVVVLDDPGHLALRALTDAAGSARAPTGPAETGEGGTAAVPGPSLRPWLTASVCGLLLVVAGLSCLFHRSRPRSADSAAERIERVTVPPTGYVA
jgi:hypothetical protein